MQVPQTPTSAPRFVTLCAVTERPAASHLMRNVEIFARAERNFSHSQVGIGARVRVSHLPPSARSLPFDRAAR